MLLQLNRLQYSVNITVMCTGNPKKIVCLALLQHSLCCSGPEPNPKYLWVVAINETQCWLQKSLNQSFMMPSGAWHLSSTWHWSFPSFRLQPDILLDVEEVRQTSQDQRQEEEFPEKKKKSHCQASHLQITESRGRKSQFCLLASKRHKTQSAMTGLSRIPN